jgi:hypothetical protein
LGRYVRISHGDERSSFLAEAPDVIPHQTKNVLKAFLSILPQASQAIAAGMTIYASVLVDDQRPRVRRVARYLQRELACPK